MWADAEVGRCVWYGWSAGEMGIRRRLGVCSCLGFESVAKVAAKAFAISANSAMMPSPCPYSSCSSQALPAAAASLLLELFLCLWVLWVRIGLCRVGDMQDQHTWCAGPVPGGLRSLSQASRRFERWVARKDAGLTRHICPLCVSPGPCSSHLR